MIPEKPQEKGRWKALAFTALMHLVLLAVLFFGVQWKRNVPDAVEVELWSSRPQQPAVAPPPPPPEPVKPEPKPEPKAEPKPKPPAKPDIAIKEEKKKPKPEPEPKKPEPKKAEPKPEVKPEPRPKQDPWREAMAREEHDRKMAAQKAAAESELRAGSKKAAENAWSAKIKGKIRGNMVLPANIQGNPEAVFRVNLLPSGEVMQPIRLVKSSGNPGLDAAIERAILKSSPLPKPDDPSVFRRDLEIKYRPLEE